MITRYLDARGNAGLYPEARLWETLTLEATADAIMDAAVLVTYETRLRPLGVELLRSLQNRLRIEEAIRLEPEILDQQIDRPVFICGLARSGTSITHELLEQDDFDGNYRYTLRKRAAD